MTKCDVFRHLTSGVHKATISGKYDKSFKCMIVGLAICNPKDKFSKPEGRQKAELNALGQMTRYATFKLLARGKTHAYKSFNLLADLIEASLSNKKSLQALLKFVTIPKKKPRKKTGAEVLMSTTLWDNGFAKPTNEQPNEKDKADSII